MKYAIRAFLFLAFWPGYTTRTVSNIPYTAVEQLLLSTAVDTAFDKIGLPELANAKTYLDFSNLQSYDSECIKSVSKAYVTSTGEVIVKKHEQADYIIQISCGALGNEYRDTLLGIPALPVPGSPMTLPELALWKHVEQEG